MFIALPFRPDASWRHPPVGTVAMMLANLLVHIFWGQRGPEALEPYLLDFQAIHPLQWLTSAFLHAGWMHLCGNLVFLYVFGAIVEDFLGHWFIPAYVLLAFSSGALEQCITLLEHHQGHALGASSAIYALLAMATLWAPRTHVSTFIWALGIRPRVVNIRVMWLAGCYMVVQVISVWLQGGEPSSEFLHSCGIVAGLLLGFLCLRERWIQTGGDDLFSLGKPRQQDTAPPTLPPSVAWDEQVARLNTAIASKENRIALAAYDVLRREHPTRLPAMPVLEQLMHMCEERLDYHRAVAIAERAMTMGPISDSLRLRYARISGMHLGDAKAGLAQLANINKDQLADIDRHEYEQLHARLERRRRTEKPCATI
jgi:membrane associated rhomboid family serine protease